MKSKKSLLLQANQFSRLQYAILAGVMVALGVLVIFLTRAETPITVTVDRSAANGISNWVPGHTSVSTEFYNGSSWPNNQGPDTTTGTAQYNARALELEGVSQHNVHIMAWARHSPWLNEADGPPDPNLAYNTGRWGGYGMDQEIKRAADKGLAPTITLAMAPGWMIGKRTSGNGIVTPITDYDSAAGFYQARVTTDKMSKWLQLVDSIVRRYSKAPYNVKTYDIWNEFKGFYNSDINNYDAGTYCGTPGKADMGYTCFYNKTRAQILASAAAVGVTSGIRTGGPYVVSDLWDQSGAGGYPVTDGRGSANNVLSGAKSYGWVDGRSLDAIKTWLANKSGAEFIALRFSNQTRADTTLGTDWDSLKFAGDLAKWVRGLPESTYPGATTLPFWNAEHYTVPVTDTTIPAKHNAFSAESYRIGIRGGYEAMLRWGADGLDGLDLWTTTSVTNNHELRAGNGLPGNGHVTQKLFKQHFFKGTELYPETISDPARVSALASKTQTLLINKTNTQLSVSVNGTLTTLAPYAVISVPADGTNPPPPPPPPSGMTLKLINADTDQVITSMTNGMTIDLKNARNLNIDASTTTAIESVRFDYDNQTSYKLENSPPYAIAGDNGSTDYYPWTPTVGTHSLTAKAYSADGATGTEVASTTISFTVTDTSTPNPSGFELLYQDDFNTLNTASTSPISWQPYNGPGHDGNGLRRPEAFSIITDPANSANKLLQITAENVVDPVDGKTKIRSGGMSNRTNIAYGKYEVRAKTEADPNGIMSGLALTWPQSERWPADGELDWYETGTGVNRNPIRSFFHWPCSEGACTYNADGSLKDLQSWATHNTDATQWHTYVMEWTPTYIKMFRDGQPVQMEDYTASPVFTNAITDPRKIPDVPHHVSLQLDALDNDNNKATQPLLRQPVRQQVDYVKVYKMTTTTPPADTTPPTVTWEAPAAGATVSGSLTEAANNCRVAATDASGIDRVEFFWGTSTTPINIERAEPFNCFPVDTTQYLDGIHTIKAVAYDKASTPNRTESVVSFQVKNTDQTPPTISINSPVTGCSTTTTPQTCSGTIKATATALDPPSTTNGTGISGVQFKLDGVNVGTEDTTVPYEYSRSTLDPVLTNGTHTISAIARDAAGNLSTVTSSPSSSVTINVQNVDTLAPNPPTSLTGTTTQPTTSTPGKVDLTWPAATDNGSPASGIKGYYVYRGTTVISPLLTTTTYTDSNVLAGNYTYSVHSIDNVNLTSATASPPYTTTLVAPPTPDTLPPPAPTGLTATAPTSSQVNLSWTAVSDANTGNSGIRGYNIYRNGSTTPLNGTTLVTTTTYGDATVQPATTYAYEVEAVDGAGNKSARSGQVSVNVPAPVRVAGDITGVEGNPDGKVDLRDVSYVIRAYSTNDPRGDLTGIDGVPDGTVDLRDVSYVIRHYAP